MLAKVPIDQAPCLDANPLTSAAAIGAQTSATHEKTQSNYSQDRSLLPTLCSGSGIDNTSSEGEKRRLTRNARCALLSIDRKTIKLFVQETHPVKAQPTGGNSRIGFALHGSSIGRRSDFDAWLRGSSRVENAGNQSGTLVHAGTCG